MRKYVLLLASAGIVSVLVLACNRPAPTSATPLTAPGAAAHDHSAAAVHEEIPQSMLAAVRMATLKYHDIEVAEADGYQLGFRGVVTGCVANPGVGAMGYHYFNWHKMDDPSINETDPEVLVYHTADDGRLALGAVEWVVPKADWEAAGNTAPPVVFGQSLHILNPALNWYVEHAWIWKGNPSGVFMDWNPQVSCP